MRKILHYLICCCILSILFFSANTATAQTLELTPSAFYIEGNYGDLVLKNVEFTNTAPVDITVNITTELTDLYVSSDQLTIPAFGTKSLPVGFLVLKEQVGWIKYDIGNSTYNQLVFMNVNKSEADIHIFPSEPTAGDTVVFLDMSDDKYDTYGIVYISSSAKSYLLNMVNGIGSINLSGTDYGNAFVKISSGGKSTYKEFMIKQGSSDNGGSTTQDDTDAIPSVLCPQQVSYGNVKDISVSLGNKTGINTRVLVTRPSGFSYESVTNSFGRLSIEFNEVGEWQFTVLIGDKTATATSVVTKNTGKLSLKSDEAVSDNEVVVEVFDDAYVTVSGPNFSEEGVEQGGQYSFTPGCPGEYFIEAESSSKTGTLTVTVNCQPRIVLVDANNGKNVMGVATAQKSYYIKLLDNDQEPITVNEDIKIYDISDPYSEPYIIPMVDEIAYWTPYEEGTYRIEFPGDGYYTSAQTLMTTNSASTTGFVIDDLSLAIVIVAIALILVYLYYSGKYALIKEKLKQTRKSKKAKKLDRYEDVSKRVDNIIPR